MKRIALLFVAFLTITAVTAQERTDGSLSLVSEEEGTEVLTFENEVLDYGTIEQGSDGNREFVFTNTSNAPVIIDNCKGSCGCTVPKCPKEAVLPGETATINVRYDTKRIGSFTKRVTVMYNGDQRKSVTIKGKVIPKEQ